MIKSHFNMHFPCNNKCNGPQKCTLAASDREYGVSHQPRAALQWTKITLQSFLSPHRHDEMQRKYNQMQPRGRQS